MKALIIFTLLLFVAAHAKTEQAVWLFVLFLSPGMLASVFCDMLSLSKQKEKMLVWLTNRWSQCR
jgi:hypothetical protein